MLCFRKFFIVSFSFLTRVTQNVPALIVYFQKNSSCLINSISSNQLQTIVYRKATDTGLIMQYTSICPKSWKLNLINFYLNRKLIICSNFTAFKDEFTKFKNLLLKNKYQKNLIVSKINKFLEAHNIDEFNILTKLKY